MQFFTRDRPGISGEANEYEAIVSYKTDTAQNPKTFYFPSGAGPVAFDKLDDVLSVFGTYEWAKTVNKKWVKVGGAKPLATWLVTAPTVNFDID